MKKLTFIIFFLSISNFFSLILDNFIFFFVVQILLESGSRAIEFEDMIVDSGRSLLPDMMTDSSGEHLYTISSSKVTIELIELIN